MTTVMDFGGQMDKTVALAVTYDFKNNKMLVVDECVFPINTSTKDIVEDVRQMEANLDYIPEMRYVDGPGQIHVDLINDFNFTCSKPAKYDWLASVNSLRVAIANNNILISHNCKLLIATCKAGRFNKTRKDFARTESLGHMDAIACLMYANRMLDRSTNPYPADTYDRDNQVVLRSTNEQDGMAKLADMLTKVPDYKRVLRNKK